MLTKKTAALLLLVLAFYSPPALHAAKDRVAVIIDRDVYRAVRPEFDTYVRDVSRRFPVKLIVSKSRNWESEEPIAIRRELQRMHKEDGIVGAVLVGQIPYTFWERSVDSHFTGINTLYYQELDGTFVDNDGDDRYDEIRWGPNTGPELWVFWMRPPNKDNVYYLRKFLKKCHSYYTGRIRVPYRTMLYAETDYSHMYREMFEPLIEKYGVDNVVVGSWPHRSNPRKVPSLSALESKGYEIMTMNTHAFCMVHSNIKTRQQDVLGYGGVLTMIYGCHTAAFDEAPSDNLTQGYVFRTRYGMAAAGTSWGAGIPPWKEEWLYRHLGEGMYLGKAYGMTERYDYIPELSESVYGRDPKHWCPNISINMLGNPFVYLMQGKPSGPTDKELVWLYRLEDKVNLKHDAGAKKILEEFANTPATGGSEHPPSNGDKTTTPVDFDDAGMVEKLVQAYRESREVEQVNFNRLDDEANRMIDRELSRLWGDFEKTRKAGHVKRAELIAQTMAELGKCALNGRGSPRLKRRIRRYLEREPFDGSRKYTAALMSPGKYSVGRYKPFDETWEYVAALYGNLGTAEDMEFLARLIDESEDGSDKQKALAAALGHCCSEEELDRLLKYIKNAPAEIAAHAATYLDEIVTEETFPKVAFMLGSDNPGLRREYYSIASSYREFSDFFDHVVKNKDTLPADVGFYMFRKRFRHPGLAEACLRTVFETEDDEAQNMALWLYSTLDIQDGPEIMLRALKECKGRGVRRRALIEVRRWKETVDYGLLMPYIDEKDLWISLTAIETVEVISGKIIEHLTGKMKRDYAEACTDY